MWKAKTESKSAPQAPATVTFSEASSFVHPREVVAAASLSTAEASEAISRFRALDEPDDEEAAPTTYDRPVETGAASALITVEPLAGGWAVRCPGVANDQLFRSGGAAERAARRIGERLAGAGRWAEVRVKLRDGSLAGRFVCAPPAALALAGRAAPPVRGRELS